MIAPEGRIRPVEPPEEIRCWPQWICWEYGDRRESGKHAKVPINPATRREAKVDDSSTWGTYEQATAVAEEHDYEGIGFVFTPDDPFAGVDQDNCRDPETSETTPVALEIVEGLNSYTEESPSGEGLKTWLIGSKPAGARCRVTIEGREVEVYDSGRFFAFTGRRIRGERIEGRQAELEALCERLWPSRKPLTSGATNTMPAGEGFRGEDADLLEMLRNANDGQKFRDIYDAGSLDYHGGNWSSADMWLMGRLAWATGNDAERMDRLFHSSKLACRPKAQVRADYVPRTIERAIRGNNGEHYSGKQREAVRTRLEEAERWAAGHPWSGRGGARNRHVFNVFIHTGLEHGRLRGEDVEVYLAERDLMIGAGIGSFASAAAALKALQEDEGVIELVREGKRGKDGKPGTAATYKIKTAHRCSTDTYHQHTCVNLCATETRRILGKIRKIRDPEPLERKQRRRDGKRHVTVASSVSRSALKRRIGKHCALILEKIFLSGPDGIALAKLDWWLGKRGLYRLRKHVAILLQDGLIVELGDEVYAVPGDFEARLDGELEVSGCNEAERLQRENFGRTEGAEETLHERPADEAPTQEEMREFRDNGTERRRQAIEDALQDLFTERPEYKVRRVGQIACALTIFGYLPTWFPRGREGPPKDAEVEEILDGNVVA